MSIDEKIVKAWNATIPASLLPEERPETLEEAEQAQDAVIKSLGFVAAAWKLGASNQASRQALGLSRPFSGLLPKEKLVRSGDTIDVSLWHQKGVECELAVQFIKEIYSRSGRQFDQDDVRLALGPIYPALEIPQTRFETLLTTEGPLALVADNGASGWAVIGETTGAPIEALTGKSDVKLTVDGNLVAQGTISALIDTPLALVTDHVNRILARGYSIAAGEYVLLGSLTPYVPISTASKIEADFGTLGAVSVTYC